MNVCHLTSPTADECTSSSDTASTSLEINGVSSDRKVEIIMSKLRLLLELWVCGLIGKPGINFHLGCADPFENHCSVAQLGLTPQARWRTEEYCSAAGDGYATSNCHAVIFPEASFSPWEKSSGCPVCTGEGWQHWSYRPCLPKYSVHGS